MNGDETNRVLWHVIYRNGKPLAAFAIERLAHEFINAEPYRKNDCVAVRRITFRWDEQAACKDALIPHPIETSND